MHYLVAVSYRVGVGKAGGDEQCWGHWSIATLN